MGTRAQQLLRWVTVWPQQTWAKKVDTATTVSLSVGEGVGSPSDTMSPGSRPISIPSGILIHPAVWPQYTQHYRQIETNQRSNSTGRTVLQMVAKKSPMTASFTDPPRKGYCPLHQFWCQWSPPGFRKTVLNPTQRVFMGFSFEWTVLDTVHIK